MELDDLKKDLHEVRKNVDTILGLLKSNSEFNKEGLVEQVNRIDNALDQLENAINHIKNRMEVMWFKLTFIAFVGGALMQIVWFLFSKIFPTKFTS